MKRDSAEFDLAKPTEPGLIQTFARSWDRFWFHPSDPTTLGLIRILAGLLIVYIHLAYSFDLQEFFGQKAWTSTEFVRRDWREAPYLGQRKSWTPTSMAVILPEDPDVRADLIRFIRSTLADPLRRDQVVQYLRAPAAEADKPPEIHIPIYVAHLRPDLPYYHPRSRGQLAELIVNLASLEPADQEKTLAFMDEWRFDPREIESEGGALGNWYWSIWFHVTEPGWMVFTHVCFLLIMIAFTVGFCTRITAPLSWMAAVSYIQRSQITLFGGDTMMNILLLYLTIGPSGAALSVDRWLRRWWEIRQARKAGKPIPAWQAPEPRVSANLALRLIQVHFCIIYLSAGTSKLMGPSWWNGTALWDTFANYEFSPLRYGIFQDFLRTLSQERWLWELVMEGGSYFTLVLEIGFPFLVWNKRLRPFCLVGALALHTGIALFMGLFAFQMLMATMVLSFVPGSLVRRLVFRRAAPPPPVEAEEPMAPTEEAETEKKKHRIKLAQ